LLDRGRHGAELTMYGSALLHRSVAAFDELKQGVQDISYLLDPTSGHIRIGAADPIVSGLIPAIVERLTKSNPDITFEVHVAESVFEQKRRLRERSVEVVIGRLPPSFPEDDLQVEILYDEPLLVAVGAKSAWTRRPKVALVDLVNEPWVLPRPDTFVGSLVAEAFGNEGLSLPRRNVVCGSTHMNNALLATGRYLAIYPGSLVHLAGKRLSIVVLPVNLRVRSSSVGMVTLKNRTLSPLAQRFMDCARRIGKRCALHVASQAAPPPGFKHRARP
jgi:DNA-binding transcriptional LysR family regulator